jgi:hypothetical protein
MTASFRMCTFHANNASSNGAVLSTRSRSGLRLEKCSFPADNGHGGGPETKYMISVADGSSSVFSDVRMNVFFVAEGAAKQSLDLDEADTFPQPYANTDSTDFDAILVVRTTSTVWKHGSVVCITCVLQCQEFDETWLRSLVIVLRTTPLPDGAIFILVVATAHACAIS